MSGSKQPVYSRGVPSAVIFTVFLAFISVYIPILGLFTTFIWSVPTAVLTAQAGIRRGFLAAMISYVWLALVISPVWAGMAALQFAGIGLALGFLFRKGSSSGRVIILTILISVVITGLVFALPLVIDNNGGFAAELQKNTDNVYSVWETMGLVDQLQEKGISREEIKESLQTAVDWITRSLPAILVTNAVGTAFLSFLGTRLLLKKTGFGVPDFPAFTRWYVPWHLSWGVILGLGLSLLGDYVGNKTILTLGQNIVLICLPVALFIGLSTAAYILAKLHSRFFKACIVFASFFYLPLTVMLLLLLGVFDPLFDFRKIHFKSV